MSEAFMSSAGGCGARVQQKLVQAPVRVTSVAGTGQALLLVKDVEWRGVASPGPSLESLLLNISAASTVWVSQAWRLLCQDR